ncbi:Pr6Pr family membrane protein [Flavobacterium sp. IMCC34852]|uniref:Pr6Pr family membrane protein n=1 Tax=Flavobacterium rivulicola TaxID=2732161 RepID=A0A7Y3VZ19_9FLAO|nr:Pr6Pr family membrane protein [Flavobacterium sp. IMCC34852]NNT72288.1 Pr6Pr family membrane protein [Flavobacterium sp. IMCC34852]
MSDTLKDKLIFFGATLGWFAVVVQFVLMMQNRVESLTETTIRFFSYFTILTNCLVALYFSILWYKKPLLLFTRFKKPGFLTATTLYIATVGIVYQFLLRDIWEPTGMQRIVDELLHSIIPTYVLVFWIIYENKKDVSWRAIPNWLLYPLLYLIFILFRGNLSGFYPYPFVDVTELGLEKVLTFSGFLFLAFAIGAIVFVGFGKSIKTDKL